jgi:hypothetical protein
MIPMNGRGLSLRLRFIRYWHPQPLTPPKVHRDLPRLSAPQRIGEVVRYSCLRLEYWISPSGGLREWARLNIALTLLIGIPILIFAPLVSLLLTCFVSWTDSLVQIVINLLLVPVIAVAAVAIITALLAMLRKLSK